ncbi:ankyrin repeat, PH and SEC7 domain containing protein secG-like [Mizuhopecten yessoensis]|uniref:Ankyrin repeat domain-containing protein 50 n=1 Tax=Mizuhopecten yessoensis TaxID=6573 RepID=A0A210Q002_MIZYE|nr:ankyrin repeat, PH and SEC7 domain containing protein secG-like [Mizuhopecten yessoensis]OWF42056.1 Ankyrin repeat domain-containing protein 50 [Mizuhopecten yessoensis]
MENCLLVRTMDYFEDDLYDVLVTGKHQALKEYLDKGLDVNHAFRSTDRPDRLGKTLLEIGVQEQQKDIIEELISKKANANLKYIVDVNNYAYTLREYKKKDCLKLTCLYTCIVKNQVEMIKLLVQGGYNVNNYDDRGCTCLWHAVDLNNYDMVKAILLAKDCDVNVMDTALLRPLHIAAMHGNHKIMSLLIRRGARIDAVQLRGWTALNLSCRTGCVPTTRMLLLNGADPNHIAYNEHTPLSMSLQYCEDRQIPELLLEAGAEVTKSLVKKCKEEKMVNLILNPDLFYLMKFLSDTPRTLRTLSCLRIRKSLLKSSSDLHIIQKVEGLPLPRLIKEYLLMAHL